MCECCFYFCIISRPSSHLKSLRLSCECDKWSLLSFRTPLHAAAFAGHVDCIHLLLAHDAPVDEVDQSGRSALMMAAERGAIGAVGTEQVPLLRSLSLTLPRAL